MFLLRILLTVGLIYSSIAQEDNTAPAGPTSSTTSTTSTNTTTASTTTTTTAATTTTTTTPATTSPATTEAPAKYSYYNVTDNNGLVCIMLDGNFKFKIEYNIANKTNVTEVEVPEPTNDVDVTGSCNEKEGTQFISIAWGVNRTSSLKFVFTDSKDHQTWTIGEVTSVIYMDAEHFPNAVDAGSSLTSNITLELKPAEVPVNMSYKCFSNTEFSNFTTTEDGSRYNLSVSLHVNAVQFEAFNKLPSKDKFVDEIHCDADKLCCWLCVGWTYHHSLNRLRCGKTQTFSNISICLNRRRKIIRNFL
ncbi:Band 3 anion transport protein [Armadillidium vulgare]|nr:Band 3 anion transport protein [Armadillidium vulgare]